MTALLQRFFFFLLFFSIEKTQLFRRFRYVVMSIFIRYFTSSRKTKQSTSSIAHHRYLQNLPSFIIIIYPVIKRGKTKNSHSTTATDRHIAILLIGHSVHPCYFKTMRIVSPFDHFRISYLLPPLFPTPWPWFPPTPRFFLFLFHVLLLLFRFHPYFFFAFLSRFVNHILPYPV